MKKKIILSFLLIICSICFGTDKTFLKQDLTRKTLKWAKENGYQPVSSELWRLETVKAGVWSPSVYDKAGKLDNNYQRDAYLLIAILSKGNDLYLSIASSFYFNPEPTKISANEANEWFNDLLLDSESNALNSYTGKRSNRAADSALLPSFLIAVALCIWAKTALSKRKRK